MNKTFRLLFYVLIVGVSMVSCKSKQAVTEIKSATTPATTTAPVPEVKKPVVNQPAEPEVTRSETFKMAAGETNSTGFNKKYHVQVGAFKNHDNARNLRTKLVSEGNSALIVENENGMLRVIIASFDEYQEARAKINQIKSSYPDAWVLVQKK
ncbi:hypothetical protein MASR2M117_12230 [Paludibacter sp.]